MATTEFETCHEMTSVIKLLSSLLQRIAETNEIFRGVNTQKISIFHGLTRPTISIESYMERIFKYANCSPSCFVVAYVYLDRFAQKQPQLPLNSFNVHRLLIASVVVAVKFMDDIFYNNAYFAKVGGISIAEMNLLEVDFLFGLRFQLNVSTTTFQNYYSYLQKEILMQSPPLIIAPSPLHFGRSEMLHFINVDEDGSTHQKQLVV